MDNFVSNNLSYYYDMIMSYIDINADDYREKSSEEIEEFLKILKKFEKEIHDIKLDYHLGLHKLKTDLFTK